MKEKEIYIYIDDTRQPLIPGAIWVKSYGEAIAALKAVVVLKAVSPPNSLTLVVDFDHDLGEKKTGYDVAKWLAEYPWTANFRVHSMNPVGANNIRQLLKHYGWTEVF